jgi:hypothetical protein
MTAVPIALAGLALPVDLFAWSSSRTGVPPGTASLATHNLILDFALEIAKTKRELLWTEQDIVQRVLNQDYVEITNSGHMRGTSPDVEGNSYYSEHYYNPVIDQGNGHRAAGKHIFDLLAENRRNNASNAAAKATAWASHYLADLHVPYHVIGIFASRAHAHNDKGVRRLPDSETGGFIMNGPGRMPAGWGGNGDFRDAIASFCSNAPLRLRGKRNPIDWFDPWYMNGYGFQSTSTLTGSHASWEIDAHRSCATDILTNNLRALFRESQWAPEWKNERPPFGRSYMEFMGRKVERFALACATNTRKNLQYYLDNPSMAVARAMISVATMLSATVTDIDLYEKTTYQGSNARTIVTVKNHSKDESLQDVEVLVHYREKGQNTYTLPVFRNRRILPGRKLEQAFSIPLGTRETQVLVEVHGLYDSPDLCYANREIKLEPLRRRQQYNNDDCSNPNLPCDGAG